MNDSRLTFTAFKQRLAGTAGLLLVVFLAYWPSLHGGFIWDDRDNISESPTKRSLQGLGRTWTDLNANQQYYPLTHTAFWIERQLWGDQTLGYHLVNTALHACNAVLVWSICRSLALPWAWLAAALFALHPVHVESVAWISELKNLLSGVFTLTSALLLTRFARRVQHAGAADGETAGSAGGAALYLLALASFLLALLAKTTVGVAPAAFLAVLWWRFGAPKRVLRYALIPFFLLGAGASLVLFFVERTHAGALGVEFPWTPAERFIIAGKNVWFYVWRLGWPVDLAFLNPVWRLETGKPASYLPFTLVLLAVAAAWMVRKRFGAGPLAAGLHFLVLLFPAMGFLNFYFMRYSFVQDHFQYLASIGPIVLFTSVLRSLHRRWPRRRAPSRVVARGGALVLPAALLAALGVLTWSQSTLYVSEERLWRDTLVKNPQAWMAHVNLSSRLLLKGQWAEVAANSEAALKIKPDLPQAYVNLGYALGMMGRVDEGIKKVQRAIWLDPSLPESHNTLGILLERKGLFREARYCLDEAARLKQAR